MTSTIAGFGVFLPEHKRDNAWWPAAVVDKWRERRAQNPFRGSEAQERASTPGVQLALDAMSALESDLFAGVRERRVRDEDMKPSAMEVRAAEDAIARAGIARDDIGAVLTTSQGPDTLLVANAAVVHRELGLQRDCIATGIDAVCNGFSLQLLFAEQLIASGRVRAVLLVQSSTVRSLFPQEHPLSPIFGDAATAVVVTGAAAQGAVVGGGGTPGGRAHILASHHITDGSQYDGLLVGNPEGWWYDAKPQVYVGDKAASRAMALSLPDIITGTLRAALDRAGIAASDVDFLATHQGTGWIRPSVQALLGATRARSHDTFAWTGTVGPCNVPLSLALAERAGELNAGDVVACGIGGAGATVAGVVLRWA